VYFEYDIIIISVPSLGRNFIRGGGGLKAMISS